jgi:hypothetical protein
LYRRGGLKSETNFLSVWMTEMLPEVAHFVIMVQIIDGYNFEDDKYQK